MDRRRFSRDLGTITLASLAGIRTAWAGEGRKGPTFLILSGWQTVNIGDIAHTPGLLSLIDRYFPDALYYLWPRDIEGYGVEKMLKRHFPKLRILKTDTPREGDVEMTREVKRVFDSCDILLHGSGPKIFEKKRIKAWVDYTGKPYGVCGVTENTVYPELAEVIDRSRFFFTRETASLQVVRGHAGMSGKPATEFFPDATFAINIRDDAGAGRIMEAHGLKDREFICVVSRLRYSPYHKIHTNYPWDRKKIEEVEAANERYKEKDHRKLRTAIIHWVRETGKRVLLCPEMTYELDIMDELLLNPLPEDVRPFVSKLTDFWITDTAASVYRRSFAVVSMECHSCIIALANGTPAFYVRQKEDTIKGQMFYDIGLSEWVFEIDAIEGEDISRELRKLTSHYEAGSRKIAEAFRIVDGQYKICFSSLKANV